MPEKRACGVLLHPSSLPSEYCIGDMGPYAYEFVDFLNRSGAGLWQILPLGPTGYGNSPYAVLSSFAGNPLLISPDELYSEGLITEEELSSLKRNHTGRTDYDKAERVKLPVLRRAAARFSEGDGGSASLDISAYRSFCDENSWWLEDYALYAAVKNFFDAKALSEGVSDSRWNRYWDRDIALRSPEAVETWRRDRHDEIETEKILQFFFHFQWRRLKKYANDRGVRIIGDIPVFVSEESADFWASRELFYCDERGIPTVVSGVPPDYFSSDGQLWGNPLYRWDVHRKEEFRWWLKRIGHLASMTDIIRIDHFRGFESYWEVPAGSPNAVNGRWVKAPGREFFRKMREEYPDITVIAEDLGVITDEVVSMRREFGFPGMKILQFAFEFNSEGKFNSENVFLPFNHERNSVVYTGTHDNDTTRSWYDSLPERTRDVIRRYLARPDHDIVWDLIRAGMSSRAVFAVFPMQDLLDLGEGGRMNRPATVGNDNWSWRMDRSGMNDLVSSRFREMAELYGRI